MMDDYLPSVLEGEHLRFAGVLVPIALVFPKLKLMVTLLYFD